eukprot:10188169-Karenia_brevis.AAC.1
MTGLGGFSGMPWIRSPLMRLSLLGQPLYSHPIPAPQPMPADLMSDDEEDEKSYEGLGEVKQNDEGERGRVAK